MHRPLSVGIDAVFPPKTAEILPMVAGSEAAAKVAAVGGAGGEQGGLFDETAVEGRRQPQPGEKTPPLGPIGGQEPPRTRRAGLPTPTGELDGKRAAGRGRGG